MSAVDTAISREDVIRVRDALRDRAHRHRALQVDCADDRQLWGLYGGWADASDTAANSLDDLLGEDTRPDTDGVIVTGGERLDRNGDTLAHVVEQLVLAEHYRPGHGPQLGQPRPPIDRCQMDVCVRWRRYLSSRLP